MIKTERYHEVIGRDDVYARDVNQWTFQTFFIKQRELVSAGVVDVEHNIGDSLQIFLHVFCGDEEIQAIEAIFYHAKDDESYEPRLPDTLGDELYDEVIEQGAQLELFSKSPTLPRLRQYLDSFALLCQIVESGAQPDEYQVQELLKQFDAAFAEGSGQKSFPVIGQNQR